MSKLATSSTSLLRQNIFFLTTLLSDSCNLHYSLKVNHQVTGKKYFSACFHAGILLGVFTPKDEDNIFLRNVVDHNLKQISYRG
jgi:hypothetical protein